MKSPYFNMFRWLCSLGLVLLLSNSLKAQYTMSGYVRDAASGEVLIGAPIYAPELKQGTTTNTYGFYSITLPKDSVLLVFNYLGYKPQIKKVYLTENLKLNVNLESEGISLGEVVISANKARENVEKTQMSVIDVPITQVKELPAIFGEKDLFKVLQLLPGVQSGSEASAGFYVRGGGPDQNLVLLDEAVVYNPFHLGGFFGTFNADALKSVNLIKGGFPAQYGGRLSSVVDISMKDGNMKEYHGEGGIGLITSRLMLEGPILKDKASFMISARRTYFDAMIRPFLPKGIDAGYYFYDLNAKLNYRFSDKDRVYISAYNGKDVFLSQQYTKTDSFRFQIDWGNTTFTTRWNHVFGPKLFSNTTLIYNDYKFQIGSRIGPVRARLLSGIKDYTAKTDFEWFPNLKHKIKFGASHTYHTFIPSLVQGKSDDIDFVSQQTRFVHESAIYVNEEYVISPRLSLNAGLRAPLFIYKTTTYWNLEPRLSTRYQLNRNTSLKAAYTWMNQFLHLLTNSTLATPMDLWIPSSDIVKPQRSQQLAGGIFRNFLNDKYESSVELYYKDMRNLIEFKPGAQVFLNPNVDKELAFGKGRSYGAEFFVRKNEGRITGWVGYTLAWATRTFPEINGGRTFYAKYDRRHDISAVAVYNFNKKWSFSTILVYGSGHTLTIPFGSYIVPDANYGGYIRGYDYVEKNYYRLKPYARMDIGIKRTKEHKRYTSELRFDIYNVTSRRNPYFVILMEDYNMHSNAYKPTAKQVSLFPIIPSVSYNFKF